MTLDGIVLDSLSHIEDTFYDDGSSVDSDMNGNNEAGDEHVMKAYEDMMEKAH